MDCKYCEEYQPAFRVFPIFGHTGSRYVAECPSCHGWTKVNIEFDPPRYGRMTMD